MSCGTDHHDWGLITRGSRWELDVVFEDDFHLDLATLTARFRMRHATAAGSILLTGSSTDDSPMITIDVPENRLIISVPGSELVDLPRSGVVHLEVDLLVTADADAGAVWTEAGELSIENKSLLEEPEA